MLKLRKFITCLVLALILVSSSVLATDTNVMPISNETAIKIEEADTTNSPETAKTIYEDLYIYDTDYYSLTDIVYGNVFASTTRFITDPRNNGGVISGNLYLLSNEATFKSDVSYSNNKDKNGNDIISSINSRSVINGNVYVLADSFTLEAGSEIRGDLYVASTNVTIEQDTVIDGNVFITANNIYFNGQVSGSAYITSENFNMDYFAYISRDLYLNSQNITLAGVIYRNAFITAYDKLSTTSDLRIDQNLSVDFANDFTFSGEVKGNATINAKKLSFKNDNNEKCIIHGDLKYGTKNEVSIPDGIVLGQVSTSEYVEMTSNSFSLKNAIINLFTLLLYVFAIVILSKRIAPKAVKNLSALNAKNTLISLLAGLVSLLAIFVLFMLLLVIGIGMPLALVFIIGYLFALGLALPLLLNDIANAIKLKQNILVKLLIVTVILYLISLIPTFGIAFLFITLLIGIGRILLSLFSRKK